MKTLLILSMLLVSCGGINVSLPETKATPTPGAVDSPSPNDMARPTPTPVPSPNTTPTSAAQAQNGPLEVDVNIGHIPNPTLLDMTCDQSDEVLDKVVNWETGDNRAFLEGDLQDLWSAERLVVAQIELKTVFNKNENTCRTQGTVPARTVLATVPQYLTVEQGNAGNGTVRLYMGLGWCEYKGGSSVADPLHPFRANEAHKGLQYSIKGCSSAGLSEGMEVYAHFLALFVDDRANDEDLVVKVEIPVRWPIYSEEELQ